MEHKKSPFRISEKETLPQKNHIRKPKPNTKSFTLLMFFASGLSLHRFQAEKLGDHCLHSSVSALSKRFEIEFKRELIKVPTRFEQDVSVMRYWLENEHIETALRLTNQDEQ